MHKDRMAQIGRHTLPPKGTKAWDNALQKLSIFEQNNPQIPEKVLKEFKKSVASAEIQAQNGAVIREYNTTY